MNPAPPPGLAFFPALFVLLWSTGFVVAKLGLPDAPPLSFLAVRFACVAVLMTAVALAIAADGLLDELCLTVSPRLVGGDGPRMLAGEPPAPGGLPMRLHAAYEDDGFLFLRHRSA